MLSPFETDDDQPPATLPERVDDVLLRLDEMRNRPGAAAVSVVVVLGLLGLAWWLSRPSQVIPVEQRIPEATLEPEPFESPLDAPLIVHMTGAVSEPGVFSLPPGSRVLDAIDAAGGPTSEADLQRLNLAAALSDGVQIWLPRVGEVLPPDSPPGLNGRVDREPGSVNINLASASELERLVGVGPATAAAIVKHRDDNGLFSSPEGLLDVRGIGPAKLAAMIDQVVIR